MVGSCRNDVDAALLSDLQAQARELGLEGYVDWHINVSYAELRELLGGAVGGLHTMVDEHFGISVVEYMAAGVIPIAHNSGESLAASLIPNAHQLSAHASKLAPGLVRHILAVSMATIAFGSGSGDANGHLYRNAGRELGWGSMVRCAWDNDGNQAVHALPAAGALLAAMDCSACTRLSCTSATCAQAFLSPRGVHTAHGKHMGWHLMVVLYITHQSRVQGVAALLRFTKEPEVSCLRWSAPRLVCVTHTHTHTHTALMSGNLIASFAKQCTVGQDVALEQQ
eukprot:1161892-Pelagomonas_calceolata.AAC.6